MPQETTQDPPRKRMGDMTVAELLDSMQYELQGLSDHIDRYDDGDEPDTLVLGGYVGSLTMRLANVQMKLGV